MRNKRIFTLLSALLILMMVASPICVITAAPQTSQPASISSSESLIVQVLEDESVLSNWPDTNYHSNTYDGGIFVGYEPVDGYARAWFKYDLSSIPKEIGTLNVKFNLYCNDEYLTTDDLPVGIYYSDDDTWAETSITWNNQPGYDATPADSIDSPASPNMFAPGNWYSWDITAPFHSALMGDKLLSLVLKQNNETSTVQTWTYYIEKDYDVFLASYLSVEYSTPDTIGLTVDGRSAAPLKDYIQDSTPKLGWTMADSGSGEYQRDYALEVNTNQYFNGTNLWNENHTKMVIVHDSSGGANLRPFATSAEFRYQMKFDESLISDSGIIDKLHFETIDETGTIAFKNLVVQLVCTTTVGVLTTNFQSNYGPAKPITVLNRTSYNATITDHHFSIDVENTFFLNARQSLIVELRFTDNIGTLALTPITMSVGGSAAYTFGAGAYTSTTAAITDDRANSLTVELLSTEVYTNPASTGNAYPFNVDNGFPGRFQLKYNKSMVSDTGIIDRIYFPVSQFSGDVVYEGLKVYLVESPRLGTISHTNFEENYGGITPTLVLDEEIYQVRNLGAVLVLDVNNIFYYHGAHDLLIDISFENKVSGACNTLRTIGGGAYRAWNVTSSVLDNGNDTRTYDMVLDFIHSDNPVEYAGTPLVNATTYYWRVKTCDSTGIWTDWTSMSFKYEKLDSTPEFTGPIASPSPAYVGSPVSVSLNVTYFLGIGGVWIEMDGSNHSMTAVGSTYAYTWTPTSAGNVIYTIYMESNIGTWSSVSGALVVLTPGLAVDPTLLLIVAGVGLVVVIVIVVILRGRGKK
ncbi:MAG: DNRLRE domain-containing protein [Candidatus Odinarchaeota archaeon]